MSLTRMSRMIPMLHTFALYPALMAGPLPTARPRQHAGAGKDPYQRVERRASAPSNPSFCTTRDQQRSQELSRALRKRGGMPSKPPTVCVCQSPQPHAGRARGFVRAYHVILVHVPRRCSTLWTPSRAYRQQGRHSSTGVACQCEEHRRRRLNARAGMKLNGAAKSSFEPPL